MGRAPCCDKATVKRGPWSPEEDAMLKSYIDAHGTGNNWIALPHKIGLKRCGKSCRLRWLNYLRPNIKHGEFTPEEDTTICSLYISIGSRWSIIAAQLPGRTDNDVKNYWNTKLKKRLLGGRRKGSRGGAGANHCQSGGAAADVNDQMDGGGERSSALSASAMERIQLCMQLQEMHNGPLGSSSIRQQQQHGGGGYPLQLWSDQVATTQSCNSSGSLNNVTAAAAEQQQQQQGGGQSCGSLNGNHHHIGRGQQLESAAMDGGGLASSTSSAENSDVVDVVTIEAELQELLYGGATTTTDGSVAQQQQGAVDWWSYDQVRSASPLSCWDFTPEAAASSVFQDYTSVYDIV